MRKKVIERRIRNAFSESVPDVLDNILEKCEKRGGFEKDMKVIKNKEDVRENRKSLWIRPRLVGVCASLCVVVLGIVGLFRYNIQLRGESIIELDVNPSVELRIDKNDDVIKAIPLNDDGKKVLGNMDFEDVDLDVAVNAIVGSMIRNGYLTVDENSILVSVKNRDVEKGIKLQDKISKEIDEILKSMSIDGAILSQTLNDDSNIEELAKEYDISVGKAKLIEEIVKTGLTNSNGDVYTVASLSKLSINELNLLLSSKETKVESVTASGSYASENSYIGKEKAKQIAFKDANVSGTVAKNVEVEFDCDDGKLVYEVDFRVENVEYEYEIDAKTGKVIMSEIDKKDNGDYDDDD